MSRSSLFNVTRLSLLFIGAIMLQSFDQVIPTKEISGSGRVVSVNRETPRFSSVNVSSNINLFVTQSDNCSVDIESNQSVIPHIETRVDRGVLYIRIKAHTTVKKAKTLNAYVTLPRINELMASGGSEIVLKNKIKSDRLYVSATVNSRFTGHIDCNKLEVRGTGSSVLKIDGTVKEQLKLRLASGSEFDCFDLTTKDLVVEASSGCVARLTANGDMKVNVGSGAKFIYKGSGTISKKRVAESGTMRHS